jgi:DNA-binding transcriptional ArsR family regulator
MSPRASRSKAPAREGRRPRLYRIREAAQIEALAAPARQEIVDALAVIGPCSIAELALDLGRAADSLYYHVARLEVVGLVVPRGTDGAGVRERTLYDVPGSRLVIDHQPDTPRERRGLLALVSACLRIAERDLRRAFDGGLAVYRRSPRRNAWGARAKGWLTAAELAELRGHLEAASDLLTRSKRRPDSGLHAVTFVLTPIAPSRRAARTRRQAGGIKTG